MTDPTTDPATEALDHFDVDLDDDDLTDTTTTDVDDTENEPSTNGDTTPSDDDGVADDGEVDGPEPVKGPEPVEVRRARRALKTARAEHRGAISRLRLAEERVVNANGAVKVAAAKAVDLEADEKKKPHQVEAANEAIERAKRARARLEIERDERQAEVDEAAEEIIEADALLSVALAEAADAATQAAAEAAQAAADDDGKDEAPQLYYANVAEFFDQFLRHVYQRSIDGTKTFWSAEWWRYDEAMNRLEAVWLAWEHLRLDPGTGPSVWWRDHADPHMRILLSPQGPFRRENKQDAARDNVHEPLPHTPPPDGLFRDERVVVNPPPPKAPADAPTDP